MSSSLGLTWVRHRFKLLRPLAAVVLAGATLLLGPSTAPAQTPSAGAPSASTQPPPTAGWNNGFFVGSADGDNRLQLGGVVQVDGRFGVDESSPIVDTFTIRKLRPVLQGRVARYFDFRLTPDFGNGTTALLDAFLDIRFSSGFRVRAGKDKTPVGLELLQSDPALLFPERSLASSLVPNRDVGVQVQGDLVGARLSYSAGVFNGIPDGSSSSTDLDANTGKDLAGRIVVQPFRTASHAARGLGFHLGGSAGDQAGALPAFRTSGNQTWFAYAGSTADGSRTRVTPAVFYYHGPLGAFAEYVRSTQDVARNGERRSFTNTGWSVTGTWILTGEAASSGVIQPSRAFDPPASRWGAVQIVARYAALDVDDEIFAARFAAGTASRQARQASIGANWYPVSIVKYYLTYDRTWFDGPVPRPDEHLVLFRVQLAF